MNYTRKALFGVWTILLLHLVAAVLGYLFRFTLARHYSVDQYGLFFSILALFFLFNTIKDLGIGNALIITLPRLWLKKKWDTIRSYLAVTYFFKLTFALVLAIVFWALAPFLSTHLFKTLEATFLLRTMAVVFFLSANEDIFISAFLGFQKYAYFACIELFKKILLLLFLFVFLNYGFHAPVLAYLAMAIVLPFTLFPFLFKTFPFTRYTGTPSLTHLKVLLLLGLPFVFNTLTYSVISYFDTLLLTGLRTLHEVGLYNAALPTAMAVLYFIYAFDSVIQPLSAELYHSKKKEKLTIGLELLHKYLLICLVPIVITFIVYAPTLLQLLYGAEYSVASTSLQILMIGVLFYAIALMNLSVLSGIGQPKQVAKVMLWAAVSNVVLNLFLIPLFGILGAAFTTTLSYALALVLSYLKLRHYVTLQLPWKNWMKTLLCGVILALLLCSMLSTTLWIQITFVLVGLIVYAALLFIFHALNLDEMRMLWHELSQKKQIR